MPMKPGAHVIHRLNALAVRNTKQPGYYADGGNLYLQISTGGAKSWLSRYRINGRSREMGLGPLHVIDLEAARSLAKTYRTQLIAGVDPIDARLAARSAQLAQEGAKGQRKTWQWCCETYVADVKIPELTNAKHAAQWGSTLKTYTYPKLAKRWVDEIALEEVLSVLQPVWLDVTMLSGSVRFRSTCESFGLRLAAGFGQLRDMRV